MNLEGQIRRLEDLTVGEACKVIYGSLKSLIEIPPTCSEVARVA